MTLARKLLTLTGLVVSAIALLSACGDDTASDAGDADQAETDTDTEDADQAETEDSGVTTPAEGLDEERTIIVDGVERWYYVHIPDGLDPDAPLPLVLNLHGLDMTVGDQRTETFGLEKVGDDEGFAVVYPSAIDKSWDLAGTSDLTFLEAVIDDMATIAPIDQDRVYVAGYSQGGAMSTYVACHLGDRIAAAASVALFVHHDPPSCETPRPSRLLVLLGEVDGIYLLDQGLHPGRTAQGDGPQSLAIESAAWAETNGCGADPVESELDVGVIRQEYTCEDDAALVIYIHKAGHSWPSEIIGLPADEVIWDFVRQYEGPLATA